MSQITKFNRPLHYVLLIHGLVWWRLHYVLLFHRLVWWPLHYVLLFHRLVWWPLHYVLLFHRLVWWPLHYFLLFHRLVWWRKNCCPQMELRIFLLCIRGLTQRSTEKFCIQTLFTSQLSETPSASSNLFSIISNSKIHTVPALKTFWIGLTRYTTYK